MHRGCRNGRSCYEGPAFEEDDASALATDASGNVYVTGSSIGIETNYDYATIKYATDGRELWVKRFNGEGNGEDVASSLALDASGNIYVAGRSNCDFTTIKCDSSGTELWIR